MTDKIYEGKDMKYRYFVNTETGELIEAHFIGDKKAKVNENNDLIAVNYSFENLKELSDDEYYLFRKVCDWYYDLPG